MIAQDLDDFFLKNAANTDASAQDRDPMIPVTSTTSPTPYEAARLRAAGAAIDVSGGSYRGSPRLSADIRAYPKKLFQSAVCRGFAPARRGSSVRRISPVAVQKCEDIIEAI